MINRKVLDLLKDEQMPKNKSEFDRLLKSVRKSGANIPKFSFDSMILTQEQAIEALSAIKIDPHSSFYFLYSKIQNFPVRRYDELHNLDQIVELKNDGYWDDEYPGFSNSFLELSSIEGEGSFFYEIKTDHVYDVEFSLMDDFVSGKIKPTWKSFNEFIEWYYEV
ncbi:hypothetical protein M9194_21125 [Vibrio sp. S4M6]|uniref:hypothetical protein n=1 Tax=Vibrio sinus TaxID=2946865 RepID=UPI00202A1931|nr:hypothetical protein [Vibrio sinus]MCL9783926.1 hypothetical protein [Vibrio sinus]